MAYENVSISKFENALNKLDNIENNHKELNNLLDDMTPFWGINWDSITKRKIEDALLKIAACYQVINKSIQNSKSIKENIKTYQELQKKNKQYEDKIKTYNWKIKQYEKIKSTFNKEQIETKIKELNKKITDCKNNIESNNDQLTNLKNTIEKSVI